MMVCQDCEGLLSYCEEFAKHNPGDSEHDQGRADGFRLAAAELRGMFIRDRLERSRTFGDRSRQLPMVEVLDAVEPIRLGAPVPLFFAT